MWNKFSAVTEVFAKISQAPDSISENIMGLAEQFVVLLYSKSLEYVATVDKARSEWFQFGGKNFDHLLPSHNALKHRVQPTHQVTYGVKLYKKCPAVPSSFLWAYEMKKDKLLPLWTTVPTLSKDRLHMFLDLCGVKSILLVT